MPLGQDVGVTDGCLYICVDSWRLAHWSQVASALRTSGHTVHTPTVAGHGKQADKDVSHAEGVASILDYLHEHHVEDMILVGHSSGGTFISKVAQVIPTQIRRLVYWNAFVIADGQCVSDESPPHYREMMSGDRPSSLLYPVWREAFMNDADEALARSCYEELSPEPISTARDALDLKRFYELVEARHLRCSYVNCTEDTAMPHGEYAWHPRFSARLGVCRLVQMPGSHEVMFSNPTGMAEKLVEAGRD